MSALVSRYIYCLLLQVGVAWGQSNPPGLSFDVASIKIHSGPLSKMVDYSSSGPRVSFMAYPLTFLVMEAYSVQKYGVIFSHDTAGAEDGTYYDIVATAPDSSGLPNRNGFRQMLQTLLQERFHLRVHRELRDMPVYALVVEKRGPKFKLSAPDSKSGSNHGINGRNNTLSAVGYTMPQFATALYEYFAVDRPVIDETGLNGAYDIHLEAKQEYRTNRSSDLSDINVFTAVQEQLGLKLVPKHAPVEVLIVDHVEKPTVN